jgi:hypothetical protein
MPFVVQARIDYVLIIKTRPEEERRRLAMNWVFEAYSNVYKAAMMQDQSRLEHVAAAKKDLESKRFSLLAPFARG